MFVPFFCILRHTELAHKHFIRCPWCVPLPHAFLGCMPHLSSQRPAPTSPVVSSAGHNSVKADKLNMSGDIWKKRLSDLLWNFLWIRVISLGLLPALKAWSHFKALQPFTQIVYRSSDVCVHASVYVCTRLNTVGKLLQGCWLQSENEGPKSSPSVPHFQWF